jgi:hypothetical protein
VEREDYAATVEANSTSLHVDHAVFKYAGTAIVISGDKDSNSKITNTSISNVNYGLSVAQGTVLFRGSFTNIGAKAVAACNWNIIGSDCVVDAAYSHWGSDAGPYPESGSLVCGAVWSSPWYANSSSLNDGNLRLTENCDSSTAADSQVQTSAQSFSDLISQLSSECSGSDIQQACDSAKSDLTCMQSLYGTAKSNYAVSFNLPDFSINGLIDSIRGVVETKIVDTATFDGANSIGGAVTQGTTATKPKSLTTLTRSEPFLCMST